MSVERDDKILITENLENNDINDSSIEPPEIKTKIRKLTINIDKVKNDAKNNGSTKPKAIPIELICNFCNKLLIKPYLLTWCSVSMCKCWKIKMFDTQNDSLVGFQNTANQGSKDISQVWKFCKTTNFQVIPDFQTYKCIKALLNLESKERITFNEDKYDKVKIWKELNQIYALKSPLFTDNSIVKQDEKQEILKKWIKMLIGHDYYALKCKDVMNDVERNKIRIPTKITKSDSFPENLDNEVFLIIFTTTDNNTSLKGLVKLGKESNKDK